MYFDAITQKYAVLEPRDPPGHRSSPPSLKLWQDVFLEIGPHYTNIYHKRPSLHLAWPHLTTTLHLHYPTSNHHLTVNVHPLIHVGFHLQSLSPSFIKIQNTEPTYSENEVKGHQICIFYNKNYIRHDDWALSPPYQVKLHANMPNRLCETTKNIHNEVKGHLGSWKVKPNLHHLIAFHLSSLSPHFITIHNTEPILYRKWIQRSPNLHVLRQKLLQALWLGLGISTPSFMPIHLTDSKKQSKAHIFLSKWGQRSPNLHILRQKL